MRKKIVFETEDGAFEALGAFGAKFRVYEVANGRHPLFVIGLSPRDAMGQCAEQFGLTVKLCRPQSVDEKSLVDFANSLPPDKRRELLDVLDNLTVSNGS